MIYNTKKIILVMLGLALLSACGNSTKESLVKQQQAIVASKIVQLNNSFNEERSKGLFANKKHIQFIHQQLLLLKNQPYYNEELNQILPSVTNWAALLQNRDDIYTLNNQLLLSFKPEVSDINTINWFSLYLGKFSCSAVCEVYSLADSLSSLYTNGVVPNKYVYRITGIKYLGKDDPNLVIIKVIPSIENNANGALVGYGQYSFMLEGVTGVDGQIINANYLLEYLGAKSYMSSNGSVVTVPLYKVVKELDSQLDYINKLKNTYNLLIQLQGNDDL